MAGYLGDAYDRDLPVVVLVESRMVAQVLTISAATQTTTTVTLAWTGTAADGDIFTVAYNAPSNMYNVGARVIDVAPA